MKVIGLNPKVHDLWIVYTICNGSKYFVGAYRTDAEARRVAAKYSGKYFYKNS